nr:hypothetical protein [Pandoravirus massiliensis]
MTPQKKDDAIFFLVSLPLRLRTEGPREIRKAHFAPALAVPPLVSSVFFSLLKKKEMTLFLFASPPFPLFSLLHRSATPRCHDNTPCPPPFLSTPPKSTSPQTIRWAASEPPTNKGPPRHTHTHTPKDPTRTPQTKDTQPPQPPRQKHRDEKQTLTRDGGALSLDKSEKRRGR